MRNLRDENSENSDCCGGDHSTILFRECCFVVPSSWSKLRSKPEPHVLQTICPERQGLIRTYGWSDLRDVSGRIEGVTGFLRVTKALAEEAVRTLSGRERGICRQPRATRGKTPSGVNHQTS